MKRAAKVLCAWTVMTLFLGGHALALTPVNLSPASDDGAALVISGCPTFSWSEVEDAASYKIAVFEADELTAALTYGEMELLKPSDLEQAIPERGFSWTPSADRCLPGGTYVWYVAAVNIDGFLSWSEGRLFTVDALAGFAAVCREQPDKGTALEAEGLGSKDGAAPSPLSLEQIISSNVAPGIGSASAKDNPVADGGLGENVIFMELQGENNTFYGYNAGATSSYGTGNAFFGRSAGYWNDGWDYAYSDAGEHNTFIGHHAGNQNIRGDDNTFVGYQAGFYTTGSGNTFIGKSSGYNNKTFDNTFIGAEAGYSNTGSFNTFVGNESGKSSGGGAYNTFVGMSTGISSTSDDNIFIGYSAGRENTTGSDNTFIGTSAGYYNEAGSFNTFLGRYAGYTSKSDNNTFMGYKTGWFNQTGSQNTFIGASAGQANTDGFRNTFIGDHAGFSNTTGFYNTFIGLSAGNDNISGIDNTFVGHGAGFGNTTGQYNTYIGAAAGALTETGYRNTCIGYGAGGENQDGFGNVFVGYYAGINEIGSDKLYIANNETKTPLIYGEFDNRILKVHGQLQMVTSAASSDMRLKRDIRPLESSLDKVMELQGVSYEWRTDQFPDWGFNNAKQIGLIAQEVERVLPELVSADSQGYKALSYGKLTAVLVEAVKELKAENEMLKAKLIKKTEQQQSQIDELRALVEKLSG